MATAAAPPDLIEDMVGEILLRCPPDDPARLVRATLVCKPWCRILCSRGFLRRYRELHRAPPLLGFFHKSYDFDTGPYTVFVPTTAPSPFTTPTFDHAAWHVRDCRHGRVLIETFISPRKPSSTLIVWDPITDVQTKVPLPKCPGGDFAAAVLYGVDGCDHLHCHGGPFLVVLLVPLMIWPLGKWSCVYSSEAGAWGVTTKHHLGPILGSRSCSLCEALACYDLSVYTHGVLAGDALHFILDSSKGILKYDLGAQGLSVINMPPADEVQNTKTVLVTMEDGRLGAAYMVGYNLHLWSCQIIGYNGIARWAQHRVVELKDSPLPVFSDGRPREVDLVGFAEAAHTIFFSIGCVGIFTFDLKSSRVRKVYDEFWGFFRVFPYLGCCSPALGAACMYCEGSGAGALIKCMENSCSGARSSKMKKASV